MIKMQDVADRAGVHISTVSRVFNDHPSISEETRKKVMLTARQIGYRKPFKPTDASSIEVAGIIVPEMISGYYSMIVHVAKEKFAKYGLQSIAATSDFDTSELVLLIRLFERYRVKCMLIYVDDEEVSSEVMSAVADTGIPALFVTSKYFPELNFDCLYVEEKRGADMAIEYLQHKGYRSIGYIGEEKTLNRQNAFIESMNRRGLEVREEFIKTGNARWERGGYLRMQEFLRQDERPEALYIAYDQMAIGALHAMSEVGLKAPDDIAVIGVDNQEVSQYVFLGITTVANPYRDMISIAARILMQRLNEPDTAVQKIALLPSLVVRSTA